MQEIYNFLKDLSVNNNKEWFDSNKARYKKAHEKFIHISEVLINEIRSFDKSIPFLDPRKCVFRIYRDVRFSADKRPFKTNFGCYIARDGRSGGNPGYYFQVEPGNSFLGGGIYMPEADKLKAIRTEIYNHPTDYLELIEDPDFKSSFYLYDDRLKTAPKGFPKEFEHIDLLRYKSYAPCMNITDEELFKPDIIEKVIDKLSLLTPYVQFLNNAIDQQNS